MTSLLRERSLLILRGDSSLTFLQGIIARDARRLEHEPSIASFILDTNGRIVDDVIIRQRQNSVIIDCNTNRRPDVKALLMKYRLRKKVAIEESNECVIWSKSPMKGSVEDARLGKLLGFRCYEGKEIHLPIGDEDYRRMRWIEGVGEGEEIRGLLPWHVNGDLLHCVSMDKGCYVGQELTARTATQGIVRRRLMPFRCEKKVEGEIADEHGNKTGKVIVSDGTLGLAMLSLSALCKKNTVQGSPIDVVMPSWMGAVTNLSRVQRE